VNGYFNQIQGEQNSVSGHINEVNGQGNSVSGLSNTVAGANNIVQGEGNIVGNLSKEDQDKMMENILSKVFQRFSAFNWFQNNQSNIQTWVNKNQYINVNKTKIVNFVYN